MSSGWSVLHGESTPPHIAASQSIFKSSFTFLSGNYNCLEVTEGKEFPLTRFSYDAKRNPGKTARKISMSFSSSEGSEVVIV